MNSKHFSSSALPKKHHFPILWPSRTRHKRSSTLFQSVPFKSHKGSKERRVPSSQWGRLAAGANTHLQNIRVCTRALAGDGHFSLQKLVTTHQIGRIPRQWQAPSAGFDSTCRCCSAHGHTAGRSSCTALRAFQCSRVGDPTCSPQEQGAKNRAAGLQERILSASVFRHWWWRGKQRHTPARAACHNSPACAGGNTARLCETHLRTAVSNCMSAGLVQKSIRAHSANTPTENNCLLLWVCILPTSLVGCSTQPPRPRTGDAQPP